MADNEEDKKQMSDDELDEILSKSRSELGLGAANEEEIKKDIGEEHINEILLEENKKEVINEEILSQDDFKKKKLKVMLKMFGALLIFLALAFFVVLLIKTFSLNHSLKDRRSISEDLKRVKITRNSNELWMKRTDFRLKNLDTTQKKFYFDLNKTIKDYQKNTTTFLNSSIKNINDLLDTNIQNMQNSIDILKTDFATNKKKINKQIKSIQKELKEQKGIKKLNLPMPSISNDLSHTNIANNSHYIKPQPKTIIYSYDIDEDTQEKNTTIKKPKNGLKNIMNKLTGSTSDDKNKKDEAIIIPSGYVNIITHTSIKGPTGTKGISEAHPVRMELIGLLESANGEKVDLKGCFLRGVAKGDITTVRNHIDITKIYCNGKENDGRKYYLEATVTGQVYDELDGGLGFPGNLVDSAGKILSRELSLAIVEGGVSLLSASGSSSALPTIDGLSNAPTGYARFKNGASSGLASGLKDIQSYWKETLSGYYPFIDSKAARVGKAFIEFHEKSIKLEKVYYKTFQLNQENKEDNEWELTID
jgi:hypothetical protein